MQTATLANGTPSDRKSISYLAFGLLSIAVWIVTTIELRLWGQLFFIPNSLPMALTFLSLPLLLPLIVLGSLRWQAVPPHLRSTATLWLAVPSMLLDVPTAYFFPQCFPNLPASASTAFGAWLLLGYAIVLITALITSRARSPIA